MSRPTQGQGSRFPLRGCHPLWPAFPDASGTKNPCHWPGPRSLATTSGVSRRRLSPTPMLMSFPPATEMFQFAGFASRTYGLSSGYPQELPPGSGLPHSEIPGSTIARISPGLFAACHVLHRLSVPRHPPDALISRFMRRTQRQEPSCHQARQTSPYQKTLSGSATSRPRGPPAGRSRAGMLAQCPIPPRSHNSLIHNLPSTIRPGIPIRDPAGAKSVRRCNCVAPELPRLSPSPFGVCCANACRRDGPARPPRRNLRFRRWWR